LRAVKLTYTGIAFVIWRLKFSSFNARFQGEGERMNFWLTKMQNWHQIRTQRKIFSWLSFFRARKCVILCVLTFSRVLRLEIWTGIYGGAAVGGKVLYCPIELLYRPLQHLQRVVKYFTARWSLERAVKCYFAARQNRENRHVKKKRGRQVLYRPLEPGAGGKVLLYRPPEPRKQACKEETRTSSTF
jgi:hypothetical protein